MPSQPAEAARDERYPLTPDRRGAAWDAVLYVPVVAALMLIGLRLWYGPNQVWAYLLLFLAFFFLFAGVNRVLGSRLMLLPSSPTALHIVGHERVALTLRNGERVDLVKGVRYYADYAGKSFGLTGTDLSGRRRQFVVHRGQLPDRNTYLRLVERLKVYK